MKEKLMKVFWLFTIGSVVGFIVEMFYCSYRAGELVFRPGLIYGPFIPIYGVGVIVFLAVASKMKNKKLIFLNCALLGGIVEYIFSFLQEIIFSSKSWDYSDRMFNINGRTSLFHMFCWGMLGYVFILFVYPALKKWLEKIPLNKIQIVTVVVACFMVYNIFISCAAVIRQEQRRNEIKAVSSFQEYLDERYPDDMLETIFRSKRPVKK